MSFEERCGTGSERRKTWKRECRSNFFQGVPPSPIYFPVIRPRHPPPSSAVRCGVTCYRHATHVTVMQPMLPSCNPCYRHVTHVTVMHQPPSHVEQTCGVWAMLPASGSPDARRVYHGPGPGGPGAGAGPRARRRGRTIPSRGIDAGRGRGRPAGAGRYQRGPDDTSGGGAEVDRRGRVLASSSWGREAVASSAWPTRPRSPP